MGSRELPLLTVLNQLGDGALPPVAGVRVIDDVHAPAWDRASEADIVLTAPRNAWRGAPAERPPGWPGRVRWVHLASAGIDYFPPWLFDGPKVTCARGVAADPIADFVFGTLLDHVQHLGERQVQHLLGWRREFDRAVARPMGLLKGRTLGLVGYGAIGQAVARRAQAFGMQVLALRRTPQPETGDGVRFSPDIEHLLARSDHLVLAAPITPQTRHLINARSLAHAKPGLHLINIARGGLVDHDALRDALDLGLVGHASLDVTEPEPPPLDHWLYRHPRVTLTPHISWAAGDVQRASVQKFQSNLGRFLTAQPLHDLVDLSRGY
ncbi:NAD(P)-dependent oxidoreductase [Hydrogenophaga sp. MI9]|uniref:NAD(P)-dependent oxidoreductase n=1 Tax=Hydrogenophaga sp. MI9 TaxID=3453719 RepID=UPI003EEA2CB8